MSDKVEETRAADPNGEFRFRSELSPEERDELSRLVRAARKQPVAGIGLLLLDNRPISLSEVELLIDAACNRAAKRRDSRTLAAWVICRLGLPLTERTSSAMRISDSFVWPRSETGFQTKPYLIALALGLTLGFVSALSSSGAYDLKTAVFCAVAPCSFVIFAAIAKALEDARQMSAHLGIANCLFRIAVPPAFRSVTHTLQELNRSAEFMPNASSLPMVARQTVVRLLREINAGKDNFVPLEVTSELCWLAVQDNELALLALDVISKHGEGYAMDRVRDIARHPYSTEVREAAKRTLLSLQARFPGEYLLRPAENAQETLLRPAGIGETEDVSILLRPSEQAQEVKHIS